MHAAVTTDLGVIDILFNNAGMTGKIIGRGGNIEDLSVDDFESTWRANVGGAFLVRVLCFDAGGYRN
jgi:3-oxoacyl-[acyl-carrier protein] reductase